MSEPITAASVQQAINRLDDLPAGAARNARAERLVESAESLDDPKLLNSALLELINAYGFSAEHDKLLLPFARLQRQWETAPESFGRRSTHLFFWYFKWATSGLVDRPDIGLDVLDGWLEQMRSRFAEAGHSMNAVHKAELDIAWSTGRLDRAAHAFEAWQQAPRDRLSDCRACDHGMAGGWHRDHGDDEAALIAWEPVLSGRLSCAEEPHRILSRSLLPLMRSGRIDEARRNHLRGYQMVRGNESLLASVVSHQIFCALTGNEARALEIYAEHRHLFGRLHDVGKQQAWYEGLALLCAALERAGLVDHVLDGPDGRQWRAADLRQEAERQVALIVARFDARNGNSYASEQARKLLGRRPFDEPVLLGFSRRLTDARFPSAPPARTHSPAGTRADAAAASAGDSPAEFLDGLDGLERLLEQAGELAGRGDVHRALPIWQRAAAMAERAGGELLPEAGAAMAEARARTDNDSTTCRRLALEAAGTYAKAGLAGRAVACRALAASCLDHATDVELARTEADAACAEGERLHTAGRITLPDHLYTLATPVRVAVNALSSQGPEPLDEQRARLSEQVDMLDDRFAALLPSEDDAVIRARRAELAALSGAIAAAGGDLRRAVDEFGRAVGHYDEAGWPWLATPTSLARGRLLHLLGRPDDAVEVTGAALAYLTDDDRLAERPQLTADLCLLTADCLIMLGEYEEAADRALHAAAWFDVVDDRAKAASARHAIATAVYHLDRPEEAANLLLAALPDLDAEDRLAVGSARLLLGRAFADARQSKDATEWFLRCAEGLQDLDRPDARSMYSQAAGLAGRQLARQGRDEQAAAAYEQAAEACLEFGDLPGHVRMTRARLWLRSDRDDQAGWDAWLDRNRDGMAALADRLSAYLEDHADPDADSTTDTDTTSGVVWDRHVVRLELGRTHYQWADMIWDYVERVDLDETDTRPLWAESATATAAALDEYTAPELQSSSLDLDHDVQVADRLMIRALYCAGRSEAAAEHIELAIARFPLPLRPEDAEEAEDDEYKERDDEFEEIRGHLIAIERLREQLG